MERRSSKYFGAGTALRQISLATGGTLTLKRSGKSRRTRSVYFLAHLPTNAGFGIKNLKKKFSGGDIPDPLSGRGRHPPTPTPITATRRARGRKLPRCWDLFRKPFPQIKIYHYTPGSQIVCQSLAPSSNLLAKRLF